MVNLPTFEREEVEFTHDDRDIIYSFHQFESGKITLRRTWPTAPVHESEIVIFPEGGRKNVNTAIIVLYKATANGQPMRGFLPNALKTMLKLYSSPEVLLSNLKDSIDTFQSKTPIASVDKIMEFVTPYAPWGVADDRNSLSTTTTSNSTSPASIVSPTPVKADTTKLNEVLTQPASRKRSGQTTPNVEGPAQKKRSVSFSSTPAKGLSTASPSKISPNPIVEERSNLTVSSAPPQLPNSKSSFPKVRIPLKLFTPLTTATTPSTTKSRTTECQAANAESQSVLPPKEVSTQTKVPLDRMPPSDTQSETRYSTIPANLSLADFLFPTTPIEGEATIDVSLPSRTPDENGKQTKKLTQNSLCRDTNSPTKSPSLTKFRSTNLVNSSTSPKPDGSSSQLDKQNIVAQVNPIVHNLEAKRHMSKQEHMSKDVSRSNRESSSSDEHSRSTQLPPSQPQSKLPNQRIVIQLSPKRKIHTSAEENNVEPHSSERKDDDSTSSESNLSNTESQFSYDGAQIIPLTPKVPNLPANIREILEQDEAVLLEQTRQCVSEMVGKIVTTSLKLEMQRCKELEARCVESESKALEAEKVGLDAQTRCARAEQALELARTEHARELERLKKEREDSEVMLRKQLDELTRQRDDLQRRMDGISQFVIA